MTSSNLVGNCTGNSLILAPRTARAALIFDAEIGSQAYFTVIDAAAEVLGVKAIRKPYRNAAELERAIDAFAADPRIAGLTWDRA